MNTWDMQKITITELFYYKFTLPPEVFNVIKDEVMEMSERKFAGAHPYNYSLAGSIEHEYVLFKSANVISNFFRRSWDGRKIRLQSKNRNGIDTPALWVNFQKKYEHNPIHSHDGDLSFVIWVQIPYSLEEESKQPHVKSGTDPGVPSFQFLYPSVYADYRRSVGVHRIAVDKSFEGVCVFFPSGLQHQVLPFYSSDKFRISVSGNLIYDDN